MLTFWFHAKLDEVVAMLRAMAHRANCGFIIPDGDDGCRGPEPEELRDLDVGALGRPRQRTVVYITGEFTRRPFAFKSVGAGEETYYVPEDRAGILILHRSPGDASVAWDWCLETRGPGLFHVGDFEVMFDSFVDTFFKPGLVEVDVGGARTWQSASIRRDVQSRSLTLATGGPLPRQRTFGYNGALQLSPGTHGGEATYDRGSHPRAEVKWRKTGAVWVVDTVGDACDEVYVELLEIIATAAKREGLRLAPNDARSRKLLSERARFGNVLALDSSGSVTVKTPLTAALAQQCREVADALGMSEERGSAGAEVELTIWPEGRVYGFERVVAQTLRCTRSQLVAIGKRRRGSIAVVQTVWEPSDDLRISTLERILTPMLADGVIRFWPESGETADVLAHRHAGVFARLVDGQVDAAAVVESLAADPAVLAVRRAEAAWELVQPPEPPDRPARTARLEYSRYALSVSPALGAFAEAMRQKAFAPKIRVELMTADGAHHKVVVGALFDGVIRHEVLPFVRSGVDTPVTDSHVRFRISHGALAVVADVPRDFMRSVVELRQIVYRAAAKLPQAPFATGAARTIAGAAELGIVHDFDRGRAVAHASGVTWLEREGADAHVRPQRERWEIRRIREAARARGAVTDAYAVTVEEPAWAVRALVGFVEGSEA